MTLEEQLRVAILSRYKSVRAFTTANALPYSTVDSILKRGIMNARVETTLKIFDALDLDIESVKERNLRRKVAGNSQFMQGTQETASLSPFPPDLITRAEELLDALSPQQAELLVSFSKRILEPFKVKAGLATKEGD